MWAFFSLESGHRVKNTCSVVEQENLRADYLHSLVQGPWPLWVSVLHLLNGENTLYCAGHAKHRNPSLSKGCHSLGSYQSSPARMIGAVCSVRTCLYLGIRSDMSLNPVFATTCCMNFVKLFHLFEPWFLQL